MILIKFNFNFSRQEKYSKPGEEQEGIFICDICPYQGTTKPMLRMHIESVHSDQKQFKCEFCPTTFSYVRSLVRHKKVLSGKCSGGCTSSTLS